MSGAPGTGAPIEPYDAWVERAPGLWTRDGDWRGSPLRRRMTVACLGSGELWIHGAIRLRDEDWAGLSAKGRPRWVVVPNTFHGSEASSYSERFPEAEVWGPGTARALPTGPGSAVEPAPGPWGAEIEVLRWGGLRWLEEHAFFHRASGTLVLTDAAFSYPRAPAGPVGWTFRLNGIAGGIGPSRVFRRVFTRDPAAVAVTARAALAWPVARVIVGHGEVLEGAGVRDALHAGFLRRGYRV